MNKILITGSSGFIGGHICLTLLKNENISIVAIDKNLFDNNEYFLKHIYNDFNIGIWNRFKFYKLDLSESNFEDLIDYSNIDYIIHLASPVGVTNILDNYNSTEESLRINLNIKQVAKKYNIPVIFTSSSEIYGENINIDENSYSRIPTAEKSKRGGYAAQKLVSEYLFNDIPGVTYRLFNITGSGHKNMVLSKMVQSVKNDSIFKITNSHRIFTNVKDLCKMINIEIKNRIRINKHKLSSTRAYINFGFPYINIDTISQDYVNLTNIPSLLNELLIKYNIDKKVKDEYVLNFYNEEIMERILLYNDKIIINDLFKDLNYTEYLKNILEDILIEEFDLIKKNS